jgi:hypothetical protein
MTLVRRNGIDLPASSGDHQQAQAHGRSKIVLGFESRFVAGVAM